MTLVCPRYDAPALEAKILSVELAFFGLQDLYSHFASPGRKNRLLERRSLFLCEVMGTSNSAVLLDASQIQRCATLELVKSANDVAAS
jgi:hypothetical protein